MQRVVRQEVGVVLGPWLLVKQELKPAAGAQAGVVLALGADLPIRFQVLLPNNRATRAALCPQALGADPALVYRRGILNRAFFSFEPGHGRSNYLLVVDSALRENPLHVGMLYFLHLCHQVSHLD